MKQTKQGLQPLQRRKQNGAGAEMCAPRVLPRLRRMNFNETPMQHVQTHWTRFLYQDALAPRPRAHAWRESTPQKEMHVNTRQPHRRDPEPAHSPLGSAMILLGIYIAMYLAVAEVVHVLSPSDAGAAPVRDDPATFATAPAMPASSGATGSNHATTD